VPAIIPGEKGIEHTFAPNDEVIKRFKAARDAQAQEAAGLVQAAVDINHAGHEPLIPGLLPQPPEGDLVLVKDMARKFGGPAQKALLASINAGEPLDPKFLADVLRDQKNQALQRLLGNDAKEGEGRLTDEQRKQITDELVQHRIGQYRLHAEKLSVYANERIFQFPAPNENRPPTLDEVWDWQMQFWVQSDVVKAIGAANASARNIGVTKSVVKRIERLTVDTSLSTGLTDPFGQPLAGQPGATPAPTGAPSADGAPDFAYSITGRRSNPLYDVRYATLTGVVATKDLPKLLDAIAKTNLMTVTGVTVSRVDPVAELQAGYYYGDDHVSRVVMTIETIWLRDWTRRWMPANVKTTLGVTDPGGEPPPPAPPRGGTGGG
jgi:hypothetical protein